MIAARELDLDTIANKSWQGQHLISTHGCGLVRAPRQPRRGRTAGRCTKRSTSTRPELYFSEDLSGYAIVGTVGQRGGLPRAVRGDARTRATAASRSNSVFKRMAFALTSSTTTCSGRAPSTTTRGSCGSATSAIGSRRSRRSWRSTATRTRSRSTAGSLWVVDALHHQPAVPVRARTPTARSSAANSGLDFDFNYVRNSVKVVVDAYDGSMTFYVVDETDPIIRAWQSAFADLFVPRSEMPAGLRRSPPLPRGAVPGADRGTTRSTG